MSETVKKNTTHSIKVKDLKDSQWFMRNDKTWWKKIGDNKTRPTTVCSQIGKKHIEIPHDEEVILEAGK